ncbi:transcription elongation factor GreA [Candidatus Saccharibacteria bacterium]|nr:transcription elongation factor GreA [Candidatus Saccharibacteria bacterium]MBR2989780.1 transcription elongation factor GreA [Candidatus Saccharibacteria bacterium]
MKKTINLTKQGKLDLEKELDELISRRPAIAERLQTARAFGDLSENQEYSDARAEQKTVENRIAEIEDILKNAKIIRNAAHDKVSMGATVTVTLAGKRQTYSIVGPVEANPLDGKISDKSPIGQALMGKVVGDTYELPNGNKGKIVEIA